MALSYLFMLSYFHLYFLTALSPRFLQLLCSPSGSCMLKDACIIRAVWPSDGGTLSSEEGNCKVSFETFRVGECCGRPFLIAADVCSDVCSAALTVLGSSSSPPLICFVSGMLVDSAIAELWKVSLGTFCEELLWSFQHSPSDVSYATLCNN